MENFIFCAEEILHESAKTIEKKSNHMLSNDFKGFYLKTLIHRHLTVLHKFHQLLASLVSVSLVTGLLCYIEFRERSRMYPMGRSKIGPIRVKRLLDCNFQSKIIVYFPTLLQSTIFSIIERTTQARAFAKRNSITNFHLRELPLRK